MFNPYILILGLFTIAGFIAAVWGWTIIAKGRNTLRWPSVEGAIEESASASDADDLLPHIVYSYSVGEHMYRRALEFSSGITPTPEFVESYVRKFPVGAVVQVYYDPDRPDHATLEPGLARGDWMVFALGIGMLIFGLIFLLFSG